MVWRHRIGPVDAALGGGLALAVLLTGLTGPRSWFLTAMLALAAASLVLRRALPLAPVLVTIAVTAAQVVAGRLSDEVLVLATWMLGAYAVAAWARVRTAVAGLGLWLVAMMLGTVATDDWSNVLFGSTLMVAAWVPGLVVRRWRLATEVARGQALRAEEEGGERARAAVEAERARIARELHDVVAHAVGIMVVQATAAEQQVDDDPVAVRRALQAIQSAGRQAAADLARMLGVLHDPAGEPPDRLPVPSLTRLDELLAGAAGHPVSVAVEGDLEGLPPAVDLSAYRVVQEALTNALKHAPGSAVEVRVVRSSGAVQVEVVDRAPASVTSSGPAVPGSGNGLRGLRERVQVFGGRFEAGPEAHGGFRVAAVLPIEGPP
jgi:signal transduction histidine kinase